MRSRESPVLDTEEAAQCRRALAKFLTNGGTWAELEGIVQQVREQIPQHELQSAGAQVPGYATLDDDHRRLRRSKRRRVSTSESTDHDQEETTATTTTRSLRSVLRATSEIADRALSGSRSQRAPHDVAASTHITDESTDRSQYTAPTNSTPRGQTHLSTGAQTSKVVREGGLVSTGQESECGEAEHEEEEATMTPSRGGHVSPDAKFGELLRFMTKQVFSRDNHRHLVDLATQVGLDQSPTRNGIAAEEHDVLARWTSVYNSCRRASVFGAWANVVKYRALCDFYELEQILEKDRHADGPHWQTITEYAERHGGMHNVGMQKKAYLRAWLLDQTYPASIHSCPTALKTARREMRDDIGKGHRLSLLKQQFGDGVFYVLPQSTCRAFRNFRAEQLPELLARLHEHMPMFKVACDRVQHHIDKRGQGIEKATLASPTQGTLPPWLLELEDLLANQDSLSIGNSGRRNGSRKKVTVIDAARLITGTVTG